METESRYPAPRMPNVALPEVVKVAGVGALKVELLPLGMEYLAWKNGTGPRPDVRLVPEPRNPVDPNAIRVEWWNPRPGEWLLLGYIPRTIAANMAAEDYRVSDVEVLFHNGRRNTGWPSGVRLGIEKVEAL